MDSYILVRSPRAKRISITVKSDGSVRVTVPERLSEARARAFILEKKEWIEKSVAKMMKRKDITKNVMSPKGTRKEYELYKEQARKLVHERLAFFNNVYGYNWNIVSIKNVSTRWGSCSKRGNLNFSYKISLLPKKLADYIVVHELCHLKEFNHSVNFWELVEKTIPDYKTIRKELKGVS